MLIPSKSPLNPNPNPQFPSNFTPKFTPKSCPSKPFSQFHIKIQSLHTQDPRNPEKTLKIQSLHPQDPQNTKKTLTLISILEALPKWADEIQEKGMRKKRALYNHEKWAEHRSSLRHVRHLMTSFSSRVVLSLIPPVVFFTSVAFVVSVYNTFVALNCLPEFFPLLRASSLPYQLTAPALALLLVFRTEASYSRFQEGKQAWVKVIGGTSDFACRVIADLSDDEVIKSSLLQYIMAFPISLKCHLLYGSDIKEDLENVLEADDLAIVLSSNHKPHCIIQLISQSLQMLKVEETKRAVLETKVTCLHEGISVCDEIMGMPIPLSYTRLTSRFLVLWHLTLPIILWDDCHWIVVPATFVSAASLFCIEEVGVLIEEPFPMLALDELCKVICSNIQEAIAAHKTIRSHIASKRKIQNRRHERSINGRPAPNGSKT